MEETDSGRPKRAKRESSYKAKAFEKFRQLKEGTRNKYEAEELDSVYETVDEKEYTKRVMSRQDDDWIVDDDGSGYVEDGRDIFDDALDAASVTAAPTSKNRGAKRKRKQLSENAGKGNLQFLLSNMTGKKTEEKKLDNDEMLSELLDEIDDSSVAKIKPKPVSSTFAKKIEARNYMETLASSSMKPARSTAATAEVFKEIQSNNTEKSDYQTPPLIEPLKSPEPTADRSTVEDPFTALSFHDDMDDMDLTQIDQIERAELDKSAALTLNETGDNNRTINDFNEMSGIDWGQAMNELNGLEAKRSTLDNFDHEMDEFEDLFDSINVADCSGISFSQEDNGEKFRFFWWDAYEDKYKRPGVVCLFGKTYKKETKSFVSCCIVVQNIERNLYFLPRKTNKNSQTLTTIQDVYTEVNESIMKSLNISKFKAKPVQKKYAFDPDIPIESDYLHVKYSAKDPMIDKNTEGNTFSHIFGTDSSFLEMFLLARKIKGPCWLEVSDPIVVINPCSWCKVEINCSMNNVHIIPNAKNLPPPPLVVTSINLRHCIIPNKANSYHNEIVMISCVTQNHYSVDKQAPSKPFQQHFCVFTAPSNCSLPLDFTKELNDFKATTVKKMNGEKALLTYFISQIVILDPDLIVGHDLQGHQLSILAARIDKNDVKNFNMSGKIKFEQKPKRMETILFVGRLICDIKISAKELIKSRSFDLDQLCQSILKIKAGDRFDLEPDDILNVFKLSKDILKLIWLTMRDTSYILRIMYNLNIIPLALQITNIAGNVMSKTLMGGRAERNEFLLLHAFTEKDYIIPDKYKIKRRTIESNSRKKPTYSGGLVLDPKVGFYDKLILLMDFNSLYPSIIQEYNICFTTTPLSVSKDDVILPDKNNPPGILPMEIRKLVESRREVKKLMKSPDLNVDLKNQYDIRQTALKLTANSMYGCLGFSNSRFFAPNLAALITKKGREILMNTRDCVEKMSYEVIYGDTDSIMINTNIFDYDDVLKIGSRIKYEINKMYKQVELDIDGVFRYLLLLKKKKYAAALLTKTPSGDFKVDVEYKGLDVIRRDWSQLSSEAGKFVLQQIFHDQTYDNRIHNILAHLGKLKDDLRNNRVPLCLLTITKQITKALDTYNDVKAQPHVQVALRYNKKFGGHLRTGDTVCYIICDDGSDKPASQRAYHVEEIKQDERLKVDVNYYLSNQIYPVVARICEPIEDAINVQIGEILGVEGHNRKKPALLETQYCGENISNPEVRFRNVEKFVFDCMACGQKNVIGDSVQERMELLNRCSNNACNARPISYLANIENQLNDRIASYVDKYYVSEMICEDSSCSALTTRISGICFDEYPICISCYNAPMLKTYTELDLYTQLNYFRYIFNTSIPFTEATGLDKQLENGYNILKGVVDNIYERCEYGNVDLFDLFTNVNDLENDVM